MRIAAEDRRAGDAALYRFRRIMTRNIVSGRNAFPANLRLLRMRHKRRAARGHGNCTDDCPVRIRIPGLPRREARPLGNVNAAFRNRKLGRSVMADEA